MLYYTSYRYISQFLHIQKLYKHPDPGIGCYLLMSHTLNLNLKNPYCSPKPWEFISVLRLGWTLFTTKNPYFSPGLGHGRIQFAYFLGHSDKNIATLQCQANAAVQSDAYIVNLLALITVLNWSFTFFVINVEADEFFNLLGGHFGAGFDIDASIAHDTMNGLVCGAIFLIFVRTSFKCKRVRLRLLCILLQQPLRQSQSNCNKFENNNKRSKRTLWLVNSNLDAAIKFCKTNVFKLWVFCLNF